MTSFRVPLMSSTIGADEISALNEVIASGQFTMDRLCARFEEEFARYVGAKHAVMVNSGSSANLLAFFALANPLLPQSSRRRLSPGDEVVVPAVCWSTSVWPIVQAGVIPVFIDSDWHTLQVPTKNIERALTDKTVAICAVHVLGSACDSVEIRRLADRKGLWLIEDTCESLGVRVREQMAGTAGHMGTFSFYFSHHITTIEGGMIVTDHDELADLLRAMRAHGWVRGMRRPETYTRQFPDIDSRYLFVTTGFNVRPTELNAAIGLRQLGKLERFNARRRAIAERFSQRLQPWVNAGLIMPMLIPETVRPAQFGYPVICKDQDVRDRLRETLEASGIETRPIICGNIARQPAVRQFPHRTAEELRGADRIMDCGIYWGTHPEMSDADVDYITAVIDRHFQKQGVT